MSDRGGCERDGESKGGGKEKREKEKEEEEEEREKEDNECLGRTFKAFTLSYMIFLSGLLFSLSNLHLEKYDLPRTRTAS